MPKSIITDGYEILRTALIRERKAAGLQQADVAAHLGRPQSFVSKYERGERRLDFVELIAVAHALGVEPATFVARLAEAMPVQVAIPPVGRRS